MKDPLAVLRETRRVLKATGSAFVTLTNRFSIYDHHYHLWGVNWLPRVLGDGFVSLLGRSKHDRSAGLQKLSEMHYRSWRGVKKLVEKAGFGWLDIIEHKLEGGVDLETLGPGLRGRMVLGLRRAGLLRPVYRAARSSFISHFHLLLRPESPEGPEVPSPRPR